MSLWSENWYYLGVENIGFTLLFLPLALVLKILSKYPSFFHPGTTNLPQTACVQKIYLYWSCLVAAGWRSGIVTMWLWLQYSCGTGSVLGLVTSTSCRLSQKKKKKKRVLKLSLTNNYTHTPLYFFLQMTFLYSKPSIEKKKRKGPGVSFMAQH